MATSEDLVKALRASVKETERLQRENRELAAAARRGAAMNSPGSASVGQLSEQSPQW